MFHPVYRSDPDRVPREFRDSYSSGLHPTDLQQLVSEGLRYTQIALRDGNVRAINWSVAYLQAALLIAESLDRHTRATSHANLGAALYYQHHLTGDTDQLDAAIGAQHAAVAIAGEDHPYATNFRLALATALASRYAAREQSQDLEATIAAYQAVISRESDDASLPPEPFMSLAAHLWMQANMAQNEEAPDGVVDLLREALRRTDEHDAQRPSRLFVLGQALLSRASRRPADAQGSAHALTESLRLLPRDDDLVESVEQSLARALSLTAQAIGDSVNRSEAIDFLRYRTAKSTADELAASLVALATALQARYEMQETPADINEAIELLDRARLSGDEAARARGLCQLGVAYGMRYRATGDIDDLEASIEHARSAVDACVTEQPVFAALCWSNLGTSLRMRYERLRRSADKAEMFDCFSRAVSLCPSDDPERGRYLTNLVVGMHVIAGHRATSAQVDQIVATAREAVDATPQHHPRWPTRQAALGRSLLQRHRTNGAAEDLKEAAAIFDAALNATPSTHPIRSALVADATTVKMEALGNSATAADLDAMAETLRTALASMPPGSANRDSVQVVLLDVLVAKSRTHGDAGTEVRELLRQVMASMSSATQLRGAAAAAWAEVAARAGDWEEATEAYAEAIALHARGASFALDVADREANLSTLPLLAGDAVGACLANQDIQRAVELADAGRGVLFAQAVGSRSDATRLAAEHPELAEKFASLRASLESDNGNSEGATIGIVEDAARSSEQRLRAGRELELLIEEIRQIPRFDDFLLPPRFARLQEAASEGPIIIVNVSRWRCDAIIMSTAAPRVVPLAEVTYGVAVKQLNTHLAAVGPGRPAHDRALSSVLAWLWDAVAEPVLEALRFTATPLPESAWPRIWWVPTGPLGMLPLHAAGRHTPGPGEHAVAAIDRVVSSYAPTIRTLEHVRRVHTDARYATPKVGVVSMPETPGASALPTARTESGTIRGLFGDARVDVLEGSRATFEAVTKLIAENHWAHFACHGLSRPDAPSQSSLLLHDHFTHPFTVSAAAALDLQHVDLAYLSACSTAANVGSMPDEAIHLSSGFLLAGFRRVIAAMWPVGDADAAQVAGDVYEQLAEEPRAEASALALHHAVRRLRAEEPERVSRWAAYAHHGA